MFLRIAMGLLVAVATVLPASAAAQGPVSPLIQATTTRTGWVTLTVTGPAGATAAVQETDAATGEAIPPIALDPSGTGVITDAAPWRCDIRLRTFTVTVIETGAPAQTASVAVRTPSCTHRLELRAAHRLAAGRTLRLKIIDRWRLGGFTAAVCFGEPGAKASCENDELAPGQPGDVVTLRPLRPGRHRYSVQLAGHQVRGVLRVLPAAGHLRVLAAGDSMIQIVDDDLARALGPRAVVSDDAHVGSGITKPFQLDWVAHAAALARASHPDVTVVFLGANDGYGLPGASGVDQCCRGRWVADYAARARRMMRSYARRGRGAVFWLLLPVPRDPRFAQVFAPVNRAIRQAAAGLPGVVQVVDLGAVFTPGHRFRQTMRWRGNVESVRQPDGTHLSAAGASIAAQVIVRAMRAAGYIS